MSAMFDDGVGEAETYPAAVAGRKLKWRCEVTRSTPRATGLHATSVEQLEVERVDRGVERRIAAAQVAEPLLAHSLEREALHGA